MAHTVTIRRHDRIGIVDFHGHVTGTEMLEACRELLSLSDWHPGFCELWDLSHTEVDVSPNEISELVSSAHVLRDRIGQNHVAFVTTQEAVGALLRLFELFTTDLGRTYKTLSTREAAAEWLEVSAEAVSA